MSLGYPNQEGGRTSQGGLFHAFGNIFTGSSISGFRVRQNSPLGMSVLVGGESGVTDDIFLKDNNKATYPAFNPDGNAISCTIPTANASNPMIVSVVMYIDGNVVASQTTYDNSNKIKIKAIAGTPAAIPSAPSNSAILADIGANSVYVVLANITVPAAATTVTNAMIIDVRVSLGLPAGFVTNAALGDNQVDTRTLAQSAVTAEKIEDHQITSEKFAKAVHSVPQASSFAVTTGIKNLWTATRLCYVNVYMDYTTTASDTSITVNGGERAYAKPQSARQSVGLWLNAGDILGIKATTNYTAGWLRLDVDMFGS